jgi:hypothetical protein
MAAHKILSRAGFKQRISLCGHTLWHDLKSVLYGLNQLTGRLIYSQDLFLAPRVILQAGL